MVLRNWLLNCIRCKLRLVGRFFFISMFMRNWLLNWIPCKQAGRWGFFFACLFGFIVNWGWSVSHTQDIALKYTLPSQCESRLINRTFKIMIIKEIPTSSGAHYDHESPHQYLNLDLEVMSWISACREAFSFQPVCRTGLITHSGYCAAHFHSFRNSSQALRLTWSNKGKVKQLRCSTYLFFKKGPWGSCQHETVSRGIEHVTAPSCTSFMLICWLKI